ncbi:hypothetical protein N7519_000425 [Penicillium mononematosum]|uniref:uncharacterized protein n=1 Tax=Penicillium mononematosum TaxID=268346 RepID=UPI0025477674|nr:uncharacterized protein N7519_000425 [Penicillium mononematosum]KAJ6190404.1 hypothetical protein N7519_000425 [Penicillium mononematosum]
MDNENAILLKELHGDLVRKYRKHAAVVETIWQSFSPNERGECFKAGAADGAVLQHPLDQSLGYCGGLNGSPGDHAMIEESVRTRGLKHINSFKNCYTMFQGDMYATSFQLMAKEALAVFEPAIRARVCVPQSVGEFIIQRQIATLQTLNILIDDILDQGSQSRDRKAPPKKKTTDDGAASALSKLSIQTPRKKRTLSDLVASARDHQDTLEEYLVLLSTEPVVLAHANSFLTKKGRRLPVHTDKYISAAVFEAIHSSIQGAANWRYIASVLELLEKSAEDKACRAILLQEISNICHLEFSRAQTLFKRHVQSGTGCKWFKRTSNMYDSTGNPRVSVKGNPEDLTVSDPQLHYMLRLCQPKLTVSTATPWIKKLAVLYQTHPQERERLEDREADSLGDLAMIIGFVQELSSMIPIPSFSSNKGQMFASKSQEVGSELNHIKDQLDLLDFVVPIDNLLEPGVAHEALKKLDQFTIEKSGTKMGFLYQDMIADCLSGVQSQCDQAKVKLAQGLKAEWPAAPATSPEPITVRIEHRKQKEKTRPPHSSIYDIVTPTEPSRPQEPASLPRTFKIDESTAEIFSRLFSRSQSRGPVAWAAFAEAMAKLGFSISPKYGSKSFTVHRPHQSKIEGYRALTVARRLRTLYGWGEETFQVK